MVDGRDREMGLNLPTIIDKAKRRDAVLSPPGRAVVSVRINGTPSHLMSNAVAAFQGEIEDIFFLKTQIIGGGAGCLMVDIDLGRITPEEEATISQFFENTENLSYFQRRYGIGAACVKRTPRYT